MIHGSAHVATQVGFDFLYLAGSGGSGSFLGEPDLSVITQTEMAALARYGNLWKLFKMKIHPNEPRSLRTVVNCTTLPVIADADTGFGGPVNIRRTVRLMEGAGVAGIHIEDQTFPKRCGQLANKHVVELDEFLERVAAAVASKTDPDFVIIARTDAREVAGNIDECIRRLKAALEIGADVGFVESPVSTLSSWKLQLSQAILTAIVIPAHEGRMRKTHKSPPPAPCPHQCPPRRPHTKPNNARMRRARLQSRDIPLHRLHPRHARDAEIVWGFEGEGDGFGGVWWVAGMQSKLTTFHVFAAP